MLPISNITGLILAGGAGRRVGGQDKGLLSWRGQPLIAHVHKRFRPQVAQILISCNRNHDSYALYADRIISDSRLDFQGPLAGLEAAGKSVQTDFLAVVSCDMPLIPVDMVDRLLKPFSQAMGSSIEISYAFDGEREQYLCAAIRRDCLASLGSYLDEGHRAVRDWIGSRHSTSVNFSDQPMSFSNYNTFI